MKCREEAAVAIGCAVDALETCHMSIHLVLDSLLSSGASLLDGERITLG